MSFTAFYIIAGALAAVLVTAAILLGRAVRRYEERAWHEAHPGETIKRDETLRFVRMPLGRSTGKGDTPRV